MLPQGDFSNTNADDIVKTQQLFMVMTDTLMLQDRTESLNLYSITSVTTQVQIRYSIYRTAVNLQCANFEQWMQ